MMTEKTVLQILDTSNDGYYRFVSLGDGYSYLIDTRLSVFRSEKNQWAIAVERLGFNPRQGLIVLEIYYYGNCLQNLEVYNNRATNYYAIYPIDQHSFYNSVDGEELKIGAHDWIVRNQSVQLCTVKDEYRLSGITTDSVNTIPIEDVARLLVLTHRELFRATDLELYKSIPLNLKKILVLDEWYHKDFDDFVTPVYTEDELMQMYQSNSTLSQTMEFKQFVEYTNKQANENESRPSSYETWQQIAKVIVTGDTRFYKPSFKSNTHWRNWPQSGGM